MFAYETGSTAHINLIPSATAYIDVTETVLANTIGDTHWVSTFNGNFLGSGSINQFRWSDYPYDPTPTEVNWSGPGAEAFTFEILIDSTDASKTIYFLWSNQVGSFNSSSLTVNRPAFYPEYITASVNYTYNTGTQTISWSITGSGQLGVAYSTVPSYGININSSGPFSPVESYTDSNLYRLVQTGSYSTVVDGDEISIHVPNTDPTDYASWIIGP